MKEFTLDGDGLPPVTIKVPDRLYIAGWDNFSPEEQRLMLKVADLEQYFEDMLLGEETYAGFLRKALYPHKKGKRTEGIASLPTVLEYFDPFDQFRFTVFQPGKLKNKKTMGYFNLEKKEVGIRADKLESDSTILHELIHLHEFVLVSEDVPSFCRDMFFMALYQHVKARIPRLEELVAGHANVLNQKDIYDQGGLHDVLFLLKSFELDIRQGYPLGTVFAYGRAGMFKDFSYIPFESD